MSPAAIADASPPDVSGDLSDGLLETVPNFSEGRDPGFVEGAREAFARAGCDVLHSTMDPDHNRAVVTAIGPPRAVEEGAVAAARLALARIDMREHRGVHPRVGALDVLPFVPLGGMRMRDAVAAARRVGARIAALGVPVYFYAHASDPPGRVLASLRRGGFEALRARRLGDGVSADLPGRDGEGRPHHAFAHPTAGAVCVGARQVLLAWNVDLEGVDLVAAKRIAAGIREAGGGFRGLRALALHLPVQNRVQIAMNLENPAATDPFEVYRTIDREVSRLGGGVAGTEVIGMGPDALDRPGAAHAMRLRDWSAERILSRRVSGRPGAGRRR